MSKRGDEYFIGGKWVSSRKAKEMLASAAYWLRKSDNLYIRESARIVEHSWQTVAARPQWADEILYEADMVATRHMLENGEAS